MKRLVIFGNEFQHDHLSDVLELVAALTRRDIEVVVEQGFAHYLAAHDSSLATLSTLVAGDAHADAAISLGGDGTLLTAVMWLAGTGVPVMGINTGHLGYLTACPLTNALAGIDALLDGRVTIDHRAMLQVNCPGVVIEHPYALNDIAILRQDTSSMIEMETRVNGLPLTTYKGDGLVVATPTGSTAYNLSVGGPIMAPDTRCIALAPVSPHSLNMRPLVLPDDATIDIVTHTRAMHYQVSVDGEAFSCPADSRVTIALAPFSAPIAQLPDYDFAATLRHKLHWGT